MQEPQTQSSAEGFGRRFLVDNKWRVLCLVVAEVMFVWNAGEDWFSSFFWALISGVTISTLVQRAGGVFEAPVRRREDFTPREAFWLDPSAVFNRERRHSRTS